MGDNSFRWLLWGMFAILAVSTLHLLEHIYGWW
jgi:hypothetical protein